MTTYYTPSGNPISQSRGQSALVRNEFSLIQTAFAGVDTDITARAIKAGDTYTGAHNFTGATLTAVTQAPGDSTTKVATTAFVAAAAFSSSLPAQTGSAGKLLSTDGTTASWTSTLTASLGIGTAPGTGNQLLIGGTLPVNATNSNNVVAAGTFPSGVTGTGIGYSSSLSTAAVAFTLTNLIHFRALQGTIGTNSSVTNQYGFLAESTLTAGTGLNVGFFGNLVASGVNRWNLYAAGSAPNYMAGALGLGSTAITGFNLRVARAQTDATTVTSISNQSQVGSPVTVSGFGFRNDLITQATAFTIPDYTHFAAVQNSIGAGSAVTRQYGFQVDSSLVGAANNFAFHANLPFQANTWNFYAPGTAPNYMAGALGVGTPAVTGFSLRVAKNITGATASYGIRQEGIVQSDVTVTAYSYDSVPNTVNTNFTLAALIHYRAAAPATTFPNVTAGGALTNQYGFLAESTLVGAGSNFGFFGNIPAQSGAWNLYMQGTANNALAGSLAVGTLSLNGSSRLHIGGTIDGSTTVQAVRVDGTIQSTVTSLGRGVITVLNTQAVGFTLPDMVHFEANQGTIGAGSTVTQQVGFRASSNITTAATAIKGFESLIAPAAGRYAFYDGGGATSFFTGSVMMAGGGNTILDGVSGTQRPLQISSTGNAGINIHRASADVNSPALSFVKSRGGTYTVVANGDELGRITFSGGDGTNPIPGAYISAIVDAAPGTNDMPTRLSFWTTLDGAAAPTERMRIANDGTVTHFGTSGNIIRSAAGDQIAFNFNGFNYVTASGAAATLQLQASGASGTINLATAGTVWGSIANDGTTTLSATTSLKVPSGTTAQRPAVGIAKLRWNSDLSGLEASDTAAWRQFVDSTSGISFRNKVRNPKMEIAQRGTSFVSPANGAYTLDGWRYDTAVTTGTVTISQQSVDFAGAGTAYDFTYNMRVFVTTADASVTAGKLVAITQPIEGFLVRDLVGNPIAIRFAVVCNLAGTYHVAIRNVGSGTPDRSYVIPFTIASSNVPQIVTLQLPSGLPTVGTWNFLNGLGCTLSFVLMAGATYQTTGNAWQTGNFYATSAQTNLMATLNNSFGFSAVMMERGNYSLTMEHRDQGGELLFNQRYYEVCPARIVGAFGTGVTSYATWTYKATKRAPPTVANAGGSFDTVDTGTDTFYSVSKASPSAAIISGATSTAEL